MRASDILDAIQLDKAQLPDDRQRIELANRRFCQALQVEPEPAGVPIGNAADQRAPRFEQPKRTLRLLMFNFRRHSGGGRNP